MRTASRGQSRSPWASLWRERIAASGRDGRHLFPGGRDADVTRAKMPATGPAGTRFTLHIGGESAGAGPAAAGRHNVANALAAAALATAAGLPDTIVAGLERVQPEPGACSSERLSRRHGAHRRQLQRQSRDPCARRSSCSPSAPGPAPWCSARCSSSATRALRMHAEMGELARDPRHRAPVGVGAALRRRWQPSAPGRSWFADRDACRGAAAAAAAESDTILVKGSRGAAMETVIADLLRAAARGRRHADAPRRIPRPSSSPGFRVFQYLTLRGILAAGTALAISLLVGPGDDPAPELLPGRPGRAQRRPGDAPGQEPARRPWAVR
jgi:UDP-N-acetylmuramoyl-tripeptide--D-alanyl-D-alanine ligase